MTARSARTSATLDVVSTPKRAPRKAGNPPESQWRSTPDAARKKPRVGPFTLTPEARDELYRQANEKHGGNVSATIEAAIWAGAPLERRPVEVVEATGAKKDRREQ